MTTSYAMPDFKNTKLAYQHLNYYQLKSALMLFTAMRQPLLSKIGPKLMLKALHWKVPITPLIKATMFAHFCGGESIEECEKLIRILKEQHVGSLLDFSGEGSHNEETFKKTHDEIFAGLDKIKTLGLAFSVFKPSGVINSKLLEKASAKKPLDINEQGLWEDGKKRFISLCQKAHSLGIKMLIDAEESWTQDAVDDLVWECMVAFNKKEPIIYQTLQLYRKDRLQYLHNLYEKSMQHEIILGIKLVRGAYLEKETKRAQALGIPSPLFATKEETDQAYDQALIYIMDRIASMSLFAGTHNEKSTHLLVNLLRDKQLEPSNLAVVFSQLLGMSDHLTFNLSQTGFNAVKYVPYGPVSLTIPYLIRRAEENSSVLDQAERDYALIKKELQRRRVNT